MSTTNQETKVLKAVQSFYAAFNAHDFSKIQEFTTEGRKVRWV